MNEIYRLLGDAARVHAEARRKQANPGRKLSALLVKRVGPGRVLADPRQRAQRECERGHPSHARRFGRRRASGFRHSTGVPCERLQGHNPLFRRKFVDDLHGVLQRRLLVVRR